MTTRCIYSFKDRLPPGVDARDLLGGKGASLAELTRAGFAVPAGFIITTETCRRYLAHNGTWPENLEAELRAHLAQLERETGAIFGAGLLVAVRSGASVSMPGMLDSFLNCGSSSQLIQRIAAVFKSSQSSRAAVYCRRQMLDASMGTAAIVQAMFPSELSGVVFTRDPMDPGRNEIVIESSPGLGNQVVSGEITPHRWHISREDFSEIRCTGNGSPGLTATHIHQLCHLALKAEAHFGIPLDIEWGFGQGELAFFQCRPIRELEKARLLESVRQRELSRLQALAGSGKKVWIAHNLGESVRFPTPLTWDLLRHFTDAQGGLGMMYRDFGFAPSRDVCDSGFLELVGGRVYANLDRASQFFIHDLPFTYESPAAGAGYTALESLSIRFDPEKITESTVARLPLHMLRLLRCHRKIKRARNTLRQHFERTILPPFLAYVRTKRDENLEPLTTSALLAELNERCDRVLVQFGKEALKPGYFAAQAYKRLEQLLAQIMGRSEGLRLCRRLAQFADDVTVSQNALLEQVAGRKADVEDFIEQYGHRGLGEMELAEPRWREDRCQIEELLQCVRHRKSASSPSTASASSPITDQEPSNLLAYHGGSSFREEVVSYLEDVRTLVPYRETAKHYFLMGYECIRLALLEFGRRWRLGRDVFFLRQPELAEWEHKREAFAAIIAERKAWWRSVQQLHLPPVIESDDLASAFSDTDTRGALGAWQGQPISGGRATASALVLTPSRAGAVSSTGHVLVCSDFTALWAPMLLNASGVILERGGMLSHSAIVARTFGIPAVVYPAATALIRDGDLISIDGDTGKIARADANV